MEVKCNTGFKSIEDYRNRCESFLLLYEETTQTYYFRNFENRVLFYLKHNTTKY